MTATELERLVVRLLGDATHYEKTLNEAVSMTRTATGEIMRVAQELTDTFGREAVGSFTHFNAAMTESTAIMQLTEDEMKQMEAQALSLGAKGKQGPTELAQAYFYLFSAGMSAKQSLAALPAVQAFATAGAFNLSEATTLASDAQKALGLDSIDAAENMREMTHVMDVLVKANTLANANVRQFSIALTSDAAAALRAVNKDVEEGVAVLATYADRGIKAEVAGSSLGRVMRLLAQSTIQNAKAHQRLGFSVYDSTGKMRNFADIISNLEDIMGGMSDKQKAATLTMLGFRALTQRAIMPLIGASEKIREYEKQLRAAGGTTGDVAAKQMQSLANQLNVLKNTFSAAAIEVGQMLAPAMRFVTSMVTGAIDAWRNLDAVVKKTVIGFLGAGAGILAAIPGLKLLQGAFAFLPAPMAILKGVLAGVLSTVLMIINPVKLIAASFAGVWGIVKLVGTGLLLWFNPTFVVLRTVLSIGAAVMVLIKRAGGLEEAWRKVEESIIGIWEWLAPIGEALGSLFRSAFTVGINAALDAFDKMGKVMLDTLTWAFGSIKIDWESVQYVIVSGIKAVELVITNLGNIIAMVGSGGGDSFGPMIESVKDFGIGAAKAAVDFVSAYKDVIASIVITAATVYTLVTAYGILKTSIITTHAVLAALGVFQIFSTAKWLIMTVAVAGYNAIMVIANAVTALFAMSVASLAVTALGAMVAALAAVAVGFAIFVAAPSIIAAVGGAFMLLLSPALAVWKTIENVGTAIGQMESRKGAIATITEMFAEWGGVIGDISRAMQVDMGIAWKFVEQGGRLAVEQIKALWPPLWDMVIRGFDKTAAAAGELFFIHLSTGMARAVTAMAKLPGGILKLMGVDENLVAALQMAPGVGLAGIFGAMGIGGDSDVKRIVKNLGRDMKELNKDFKIDDTGIKDARKGFEALRKELEDAEWDKIWEELDRQMGETGIEEKAKELAKSGEKLGTGFGKEMTKGLEREIGKFDAVLFGSAESVARFADYQERLAKGGDSTFTATTKVNQDLEDRIRDVEDLIVAKETRDILKRIEKKDGLGIEVAVA